MLLLILAILLPASMALITWLQHKGQKGEKKIPHELKLALITRTVFLNPQMKK